MRIVWGLACVFAVSAWSLHARADQMDDSVRQAIVPNWNIDYAMAEACPKPFQLHVALKPGGIVQDVSLNGEPSGDTACKSLVESAKRAVLKSSPLPVPNDISAMDLNFDIPSMLQEQ